jgi:Tol biopolymer transport system component
MDDDGNWLAPGVASSSVDTRRWCMNCALRSAGLFAILSTALGACRDNQAPLPPIPGHLAFVSTRGRLGQYDIFFMNADGSGIMNLTDSLADDEWPSWSPDSLKIAFQSDRDVNAGTPLDIFVMNANGTNVVQLTTDTTQEGQPAWSPDGSKIAFVSNRGGSLHIYTMNAADGTGITALTTGIQTDAQPAWSPDGKKIAFATNRDGNDEVYVMNSDGTNPVNLTTHPGFDDAPAWSPDGTKISFMSTRNSNTYGIYVMNSDGSNVTKVYAELAPAEYPAWSPDARYLAFDSGGDIYVVQADGSGLRRITGGGSVNVQARWRP